MPTFQSALLLLSRICISALFLWAGIAKIMDLEGTAQYMSSKQMPLIFLFLPSAIFFSNSRGASIVDWLQSTYRGLDANYFYYSSQFNFS